VRWLFSLAVLFTRSVMRDAKPEKVALSLYPSGFEEFFGEFA
jgi:hypothetical protein